MVLRPTNKSRKEQTNEKRTQNRIDYTITYQRGRNCRKHHVFMGNNTAVSIIGGADGPASIFIAGKIGNSAVIYIVTDLCIIATAALGMFAVKRRHK